MAVTAHQVDVIHHVSQLHFSDLPFNRDFYSLSQASCVFLTQSRFLLTQLHFILKHLLAHSYTPLLIHALTHSLPP